MEPDSSEAAKEVQALLWEKWLLLEAPLLSESMTKHIEQTHAENLDQEQGSSSERMYQASHFRGPREPKWWETMCNCDRNQIQHTATLQAHPWRCYNSIEKSTFAEATKWWNNTLQRLYSTKSVLQSNYLESKDKKTTKVLSMEEPWL